MKVELVGVDALTLNQAEALLKAAQSAMMRHDFRPEDSDLSRKERLSLDQAWSKLERVARFAKETSRVD